MKKSIKTTIKRINFFMKCVSSSCDLFNKCDPTFEHIAYRNVEEHFNKVKKLDALLKKQGQSQLFPHEKPHIEDLD